MISVPDRCVWPYHNINPYPNLAKTNQHDVSVKIRSSTDDYSTPDRGDLRLPVNVYSIAVEYFDGTSFLNSEKTSRSDIYLTPPEAQPRSSQQLALRKPQERCSVLRLVSHAQMIDAVGVQCDIWA